MMGVSTTRVGVIGAGVISSTMHIPVLRAMPEISLAWVCDINAGLADKVARLNRIGSIRHDDVAAIKDVDLLLLAIPVPPRADYLKLAASSGQGVLVEKPLAASADLHAGLMAQFADWQVGIGFQRRYYAQNLLVRDLIRHGALGALQKIVLREGGRITRSGGGGDYQVLPAAQGGGITLNLASHGIDLAMWIVGATGFAVNANTLGRDVDTDLAVKAQITLRTSGQPVDFDLEVSWLATLDNRMDFHFEHGTVRTLIGPSDHALLLASNGTALCTLQACHGAFTSAQAFCLEWRDMIRALATRTPQPISPRDTLNGARLAQALLETGS